MHGEQLPLFSHGLAPLGLGQRVRVITEDWEGEVAQINIPGDRYAVFSWTWHGPITAGLPIFRRDELEALESDL